MARDKVTITVTIEVSGPDYELESKKVWDEHFHHNTAYVNSVMAMVDAAMEQTTLQFRIVDKSNDVTLTPYELAKFEEWCAEEHAAEEAIRDKVEALGDELGIKICSWGLGSDQLLANDVIEHGNCRFDYDGGWGEAVSGEVIQNPTYQDLWKAADRAVRLSGDTHHVFFENAYNRTEEDGVVVYQLTFGS